MLNDNFGVHPLTDQSAHVRFRAREVSTWLQARAEQLDLDRHLASQVLPQLGQAGLFRIGVPTDIGGSGGTILHAIDAIATIAEDSMAAALVFWGQRAFVECLLQSENTALRASLLPSLLSGELAGAVGLSNGMKFLSKMEALQLSATAFRPVGGVQYWTLTGSIPWVTNLRPEGFVAAIATDHTDGKQPSIFAVPNEIEGVIRSDDLDLVALRATNTAALYLQKAVLDESFQIASNAPDFLAGVRPNLLGLQCGLSIGLTRRSLRSLDSTGPIARSVLADNCRSLEAELHGIVLDLLDGISSGEFIDKPKQLFSLRLLLASLVQEANILEVHATGGRGYIRGHADLARRRREAAFIPIITPSVVEIRSLFEKNE
ncbi:acyl-CoA dehydrogenase [Paraburkholderia sp. 5N]|uniref:Acyl-CoA dehydrogenase n=2 Tax=Paraburkholderia elongata TaxID=2675747 RepID=A0A972SJ61_9BURK|nr:acyl-CoA dehydrogenase [Paraburkholderia elongata]